MSNITQNLGIVLPAWHQCNLTDVVKLKVKGIQVKVTISSKQSGNLHNLQEVVLPTYIQSCLTEETE